MTQPFNPADYYGPAPAADLGDVDAPGYYTNAPSLGDVGPPPVTDAGPMYNYGSYADPGAPPQAAPPPVRPVGAQLSQVGNPQAAPFSGTSPDAPYLGEIEDLAPSPPRPSFARGPAPSDLQPSAPVADPAAAKAAATALAYYGGAKPPGKPTGGGGGGVPVGPSPGTKAFNEKLGTYDAQKAAIQSGANAEKGRADLMQAGMADIASRRQTDAQLQQMDAAEAKQRFEDYQAETQRQIDDVRSQKINPTRMFADGGSKVSAVIGGLLGGIYMGLNRLSSNPFLDNLNKVIDRDIAAQETDLRTKKEGIGDRRNMLSEMRGIYKDDALAKAQAKNLYLESAKEQLMAEAAKYDSPAIQARADQAIPELTRAQDDLKLQKLAQEAAARAQAAAAMERQRQKDFENRIELHKAHNEDRKLDIEEGKEGGKQSADDAQRFVGTGKDANGNPTGYLERNATGAKEREDSRIAATALLKKIDRVQEIRKGQGTLGRTLNRQDPGDTIQLYTPEWQTQLRHLNAEATTDWSHAKKLGALSESDRQLARDALGNWESRGSKADEQLDELRRTIQSALDAEAESASGARATKVIGADGKEHIIVTGGANALSNPKTVPRQKVGP